MHVCATFLQLPTEASKEFQAVMNYPVWVLRTKLRSSAKALYTIMSHLSSSNNTFLVLNSSE